MSALDVLYRHLLWITCPLLCLSILVLFQCIVHVVRLVKQSLMMRLPLVGEQVVDFAEAGKVVLCAEGPRFTTRFAWLHFSLESEDGAPVPWGRRWFRGVTSGVSTVRMELRSFTIPSPGRYLLRVEGLDRTGHDADQDDPRLQLVFMRPHLLKSVAYVVGITLSGGIAIASLVFSLIRIFE